MKKALLLLTTGFALVLAGCGNSSSSSNSANNNDSKYKTEMTKGNTAVDNGKYAKASDHFEAATKLKKTDKASASEKQADNLVKAKSLMNQRKFSDAKKALNKVIDQDNGNKKMTSHAKDLKKQVNKIQKNRNNYKLDIKNAKAMIKAGNGDQAKSLLEQVTKAKGIKGKYYSDLYTQAKTLLESVPETSTNDTTTTDTNNSSNDTNTDTTTSSDDQSDNPAAKGDFDVEKREVGGKEITDQDIANARQQLTDQGVKTVGAWSDNDIIRAIKNAHADGRTTIQPSDAKVR
ncbi:hypothetical protein C5L30_001223 [Companilactobacillus farciminis]|uniref:Lipoprotein n=1 Tax=Companilactobacillus farciminis TaxID=1612 RepID=A0A4R5NH66_9LACO|nr:lipoprotein [Companilactobacillus farciminis]ATO45632.1 hypothetical protein LF20184_02155 [Companilactobacillus farciminis KCTC 3681 = DSM 20184]KRK61389.1 lipoprotein [Companilactobacillus farciminis KCTC 3681 = DSM 20184]TDG73731.1 hypothetical protein C5L30_001223 [Companilactobacillus farciminis]